MWSLVEEEANTPWQYVLTSAVLTCANGYYLVLTVLPRYGSGQPLYRHTLVLVVGGAVIMNCYHHAAGDGTSGQLPSLLVLLSDSACV